MPRRIAELDRSNEASRYWACDDLGGVELLWARFLRHSYRPHSHAGYVIAAVTSGVEAVNCRGELHRAGPGDILFVNPEEIHDGQRGADGGWQYRVFYPTVAALQTFVADDGGSGAVPYFTDTVVRDPMLAQRLTRLHAKAQKGGVIGLWDQVEWTDLLGTLIARYSVLKGHAPPGRPEPSRVRRARELIEAEFDQPLSLGRLAGAADLSPYHLLRCFKAETGVAPHAYLIALRLRRAKGLLDDQMSAAEAAATVGFVDQSHFIKHFKSAYGFTPGQYVAARADRR